MHCQKHKLSMVSHPKATSLLQMFSHENELKDLWHKLVALFHNEKFRESAGWEHRGRLGSSREGGMHLCIKQASRLAFFAIIEVFKPQRSRSLQQSREWQLAERKKEAYSFPLHLNQTPNPALKRLVAGLLSPLASASPGSDPRTGRLPTPLGRTDARSFSRCSWTRSWHGLYRKQVSPHPVFSQVCIWM